MYYEMNCVYVKKMCLLTNFTLTRAKQPVAMIGMSEYTCVHSYRHGNAHAAYVSKLLGYGHRVTVVETKSTILHLTCWTKETIVTQLLDHLG